MTPGRNAALHQRRRGKSRAAEPVPFAMTRGIANEGEDRPECPGRAFGPSRLGARVGLSPTARPAGRADWSCCVNPSKIPAKYGEPNGTVARTGAALNDGAQTNPCPRGALGAFDPRRGVPALRAFSRGVYRLGEGACPAWPARVALDPGPDLPRHRARCAQGQAAELPRRVAHMIRHRRFWNWRLTWRRLWWKR